MIIWRKCQDLSMRDKTGIFSDNDSYMYASFWVKALLAGVNGFAWPADPLPEEKGNTQCDSLHKKLWFFFHWLVLRRDFICIWTITGSEVSGIWPNAQLFRFWVGFLEAPVFILTLVFISFSPNWKLMYPLQPCGHIAGAVFLIWSTMRGGKGKINMVQGSAGMEKAMLLMLAGLTSGAPSKIYQRWCWDHWLPCCRVGQDF